MKICFTFKMGFQKKISPSKAPTFFSRKPLAAMVQPTQTDQPRKK